MLSASSEAHSATVGDHGYPPETRFAGRLDISGPRQGLEGGEAVLTLRAVIANGELNEYLALTNARERQRLYPGAEQDSYTLGA